MKEVGVYQAKTHLPRLLNDVERGETVTITRHGRPIAQLVPISKRRRTVREAIKSIEEFRKSHSLDGMTVRDLIEEGRRF